MAFEDMEKLAVETYSLNMNYLKKSHPKLHKKLELFETGLNANLIKEKFNLEYKDGYFDVLNLETNEYFYNQNSEDYAKELVKNKLNNFSDKNSFKLFYGLEFSEDVMKSIEQANAFSDAIIFNAPIIDYVNRNIPNKEEMKIIPKMIILGVGLGTHLAHIHMKSKSKIYLIVEPNLELFRLSLFTVNYSLLGGLSKLVFSVGDTEEEFNESFNDFYKTGFIYNHYFKHFIFSNTCEIYINMIQTRLVTQHHITYDYSRLIQGFSRTVEYIKQDYPILNLNSKENKLYKNKPILVLGAGPSLQRNIEFVKENKDKFIIVAFYVLLPFLEKNDIKPDIITQYDQGGEAVLKSLKDIKDMKFFRNALFLFASHLDKRVIDSFPQENIFLFQAMYDLKVGFGAQTAPSIGEITYALLLKMGVSSIYMLGVDMALDPETNKTHIDEHNHSRAIDSLEKDLKEKEISRFSLNKNMIKIKGNFREEVNSLPLFKPSISIFNHITKTLVKEGIELYNLSDGAYLENFKPLKVSNINKNLKTLNKLDIKESAYEVLLKRSEKGFNKIDKDIIELKIKDAEKIKEKIEVFFKVKDSNLDVYEQRLGIFVNDIVYKEYKCIELKNIMLNYIMHNMHYVYHLLNMKALLNPKNNLKNINKILKKQMLKIVDVYIKMLSECKKEEK